MDLVGPLPRSSLGHQYILVILDYATRYPEAIPLRTMATKGIARELMMLFSPVGLPDEILTDQGTPLMSRIMKDLCRLMKVTQLRTTVYHPQTDGLVERFNQTLKKMLKKAMEADGRSWDQLLPALLDSGGAPLASSHSSCSTGDDREGCWTWQKRPGSTSRLPTEPWWNMWRR